MKKKYTPFIVLAFVMCFFTNLLFAQTIVFSENFDGVVAPALPAGWTTSQTGATPPALFATTTTSPDTAPNLAFTNGVTSVATNSLISPSIILPAGQANFQLSFRQTRNFEGTATCFDGAILELSTDGGTTFNNVTSPTVGGIFAINGYNGTVSTGFSNPLGGQSAFCFAQASYVTTNLNLPGTFSGQTIKLRWRAGWDSSTALISPNWRIDTITLTAFPPNAAAITISGRVMTAQGRGIGNAIVTITESDGTTRTTRTGAFGYYKFDEISSGQTVIISINSKRFQFSPKVLNTENNLIDLNFYSNP